MSVAAKLSVLLEGTLLRAFHGTNNPNIKKFDVRHAPVNDDGYMGAGLYVHQNLKYAKSYARMAADIKGGTPTVYEITFAADKVLHDPDTTYGMEREDVIKWTNDQMKKGFNCGTNDSGEWVIYSGDINIHAKIEVEDEK